MEPAVNLAALVPNDTWWPLLPSRQLKRKPIALERLGAQVVVWRNGRGEAQAHGRFCPTAAPTSARVRSMATTWSASFTGLNLTARDSAG